MRTLQGQRKPVTVNTPLISRANQEQGMNTGSREVKIASLVARGDSTTDIAHGMFLSRRTVQTYISRILTKLGASSRVDIVREALRHGVSA
jgi:DNA-binding NarL/FixJ family response regulator